MFQRHHILSLGAVILLAGSAAAQTQPPMGQSGSPAGMPRETMPGNPGSVPQDQQIDPYRTDKDFITSAQETSATEVQLGKLAEEKASTDAVKELGKRMVETHAQTGEQLKQAATALHIQMPSEPPRKAKKAEDKLSKLSGADFDHAYAKLAADEAKQAVKQFEREARDGKVQGVKDFAGKNLSAEQDCLKQAEDLVHASTGTIATPR